MRISKKLLLFLVAVVLVLGAGATAYAVSTAPTSFPDVPPDYWAYDSIMKMTAQGVVQGHADGTFGPDEFVTRAQNVTFIDRAQQVCTQCHNAGTELTGREQAWETSLHGSGEIFIEDGEEAGCAGCHSGAGFSAMIAAGQTPGTNTAESPNPTRQDCRACHQIHETYTASDWGLETTAPVALYAPAIVGSTYNGGEGNLCAVCHQPRRTFPAATDGKVAVTARFGPHHAPQAAMLLGIAGAGATAGSPFIHYTAVADTCVGCHMGEDASHTFAPRLEACVTCHPAAEDFDVDGTQTEVTGMLDDLQAALTAAGLLDAEGQIVAGTYPEAQAAALWNWLYVGREDKSLGVHNPPYAKALLQAGLDAMK